MTQLRKIAALMAQMHAPTVQESWEFTAATTATFTPSITATYRVLVVGSGAGGGYNNWYSAADGLGGGGGGSGRAAVWEGTLIASTGYTYTVGAAGAQHANGNLSSFGSGPLVSAAGGNVGADATTGNSGSGGSGGSGGGTGGDSTGGTGGSNGSNGTGGVPYGSSNGSGQGANYYSTFAALMGLSISHGSGGSGGGGDGSGGGGGGGWGTTGTAVTGLGNTAGAGGTGRGAGGGGAGSSPVGYPTIHDAGAGTAGYILIQRLG